MLTTTDTLPDSRLRDPIGTVMVDWVVEDEFGVRKTIGLELERIYCFNCGKDNGYVPKDIMSFVSWLCEPCAEKWGERASLHTSPDAEFWQAVASEMMARYGHILTQQELAVLAECNGLPRELQLLERESPYRRMVK